MPLCGSTKPVQEMCITSGLMIYWAMLEIPPVEMFPESGGVRSTRTGVDSAAIHWPIIEYKAP